MNKKCTVAIEATENNGAFNENQVISNETWTGLSADHQGCFEDTEEEVTLLEEAQA